MCRCGHCARHRQAAYGVSLALSWVPGHVPAHAHLRKPTFASPEAMMKPDRMFWCARCRNEDGVMCRCVRCMRQNEAAGKA